MNKFTANILVVDDDEDLRRLMIHKFKRKGLEVDEAHNIASAVQLLYGKVYDMIILDLNMEPESGYVLFDFLKNDPRLKWIPLIVLSGSESVSDKVRCLDLGADDYVTKPFVFDELLARVNRVVARSKQFEQMAFKDSLTGLYNRRYFDNQLGVELERVQRIPMELSLAVIDIDRFKFINDTYGHPLGDQVLQGLAYIIKENLRKSDLLARYGGEEFIVLMHNTDELTARGLLMKVLEVVRGTVLARMDEKEIFITFSCGVLNWSSELTADEWLQQTDDLLYEAKQQGRNRIVSKQGSQME
jgi:two-component system cell cycle response regulator